MPVDMAMYLQLGQSSLSKKWGAYFSAISGRKFDLTTVLRLYWPLKWRRRGFITISVTFVLFLNCLQAHRLFSCGFLLKVAKMDFSGWNHKISIKLLTSRVSGKQHCRRSICIVLIAWVWHILRLRICESVTELWISYVIFIVYFEPTRRMEITFLWHRQWDVDQALSHL